jgi:hypothetical protein
VETVSFPVVRLVLFVFIALGAILLIASLASHGV